MINISCPMIDTLNLAIGFGSGVLFPYIIVPLIKFCFGLTKPYNEKEKFDKIIKFINKQSKDNIKYAVIDYFTKVDMTAFIDKEYWYLLGDILTFLKRKENFFITKKIEQQRKIFTKHLEALINLYRKHCFLTDSGRFFRIYPEIPKLRMKYQDELNSLANQFIIEYRNFILLGNKLFTKKYNKK